MKLKLVVDKSIRGEPCKAGDVVEVGNLCGKWLIDNNFAKKVSSVKKSDS